MDSIRLLKTPYCIILVILSFLMILGLYIEFGAKAALLRLFLTAVVGVTLFLVTRVIWNTRIARITILGWLGVNFIVFFAPYEGQFEISGIGWQPMDGYTEIHAQIPTFLDSPRWNMIKSVPDAQPYLYFSMSRLKDNDSLVIFVNDKKFSNIPDYEGVSLTSPSAGYAMPIEFAVLEERPVMDLRFELKSMEGVIFFTGFYEDDGLQTRSQEVCNSDGCVASESAFAGAKLVIEIRVADSKGRTLGLLH